MSTYIKILIFFSTAFISKQPSNPFLFVFFKIVYAIVHYIATRGPCEGLDSKGKKRDSWSTYSHCNSLCYPVFPLYFPVLPYTSLYFHCSSLYFHCTFLYFPILPYTSLYFPILPYTSLYFPILSYASLYFPITPCTSLYFHCTSTKGKQKSVILWFKMSFDDLRWFKIILKSS